MLKPQNIVQAAEADLKRAARNVERAFAEQAGYEPYAFHRKHVRRAGTANELLLLALMDPTIAEKTVKPNTRMIYRDARLLLDAIKSPTS